MAQPQISPFAPAVLPSMPQIAGLSLVAAEAGIRYRGRKDLLLAAFDEGTVAAGVTTQSLTRSAPVNWCRTQLAHGKARGLVVNAGNANAFTGMRGVVATEMTASTAAKALRCGPEEIFLASTGVIGEPLDVSRFAVRLGEMAQQGVRPPTQAAWQDAATAIMTTDTYPKLSATVLDGGGGMIRIGGIAKGSGMVAPDMATMLAFVFTDAAIDRALLQQLLREINAVTFNCITVDSDTSTSDTLLAFATGQTRAAPIKDRDDPRYHGFREALHAVVHDLAMQVVKDGEGISKFVSITVNGADHLIAARRIGMSIANSPLVKTAIAGADANWGRIVMAVGKSGAHADRDKLSIMFGPHIVAENGERAESYNELTMSTYMKRDTIDITVDVGVGNASATVWTCDLTHGYIDINADYRS